MLLLLLPNCLVQRTTSVGVDFLLVLSSARLATIALKAVGCISCPPIVSIELYSRVNRDEKIVLYRN